MHRRTIAAGLLALLVGIEAVTAHAADPKGPAAEAIQKLAKLKAAVTMNQDGDTTYYSVSFFGSNATDADVKLLADLKPLRNVALGQNNTDAAIDELAGIGDFTSLYLRNTKCTVKGIKKLAGFAKLDDLRLYGDVTDDWLKEMANVPNLQTLAVSSSQATKAGFAHLADCKNLRRLEFDCMFDDATLKTIAACKGIETLTIYNLFINDDAAGLKDLADMPKLNDLFVSSIQFKDVHVKQFLALKQIHKLAIGAVFITDAAVPDLSQMTWLESLNVFATDVSKAGADKLRKALPKCEIQAK